ncbi:hypothetical protein Mapa_013151 [Marchantia paleacea]|nr:hypothetical protein Mapa_013151 [Marchantia paleacea]
MRVALLQITSSCLRLSGMDFWSGCNSWKYLVRYKLILTSVPISTETNGPKLSSKFSIPQWALTEDVTPDNSFLAVDNYRYIISFKVPNDFGEVGAFVIRNNHRNEFYLSGVTLETPDKSITEFLCNSWVYNTSFYKHDRVFFSNKVQANRQLRNLEILLTYNSSQ